MQGVGPTVSEPVSRVGFDVTRGVDQRSAEDGGRKGGQSSLRPAGGAARVAGGEAVCVSWNLGGRYLGSIDMGTAVWGRGAKSKESQECPGHAIVK